MSAAYDELLARMREAATLGSAASVLSWDQETMMPPAAAGFRAEELALLARLAHERATHPRVGELLAACEADAALAADDDARANLRELRRDFDRASKLPASLVAEMGETSSLAVEAWKEARPKNDFAALRPWLEKQVRLKRRKAECYGAPPGGELYDALLDDHEPGVTGAALERVFAPLRAELVPLISAIRDAGAGPDRAPLAVRVDLERQRALNGQILASVGYDLSAGRLDTSAHPFSTGLGPGDTRITTRYREDGFLDALGSTLHEAGHALYEQGLPKAERWGQPLAETLGLGIHESQSRLWENQVGRSRAFWEWAFPLARAAAGPAFEGLAADDVYRAINAVAPNLIRIESDEATYNLHIMLRFDLERAMIRGDLAVTDLPGAWNERIRRDLGLTVPDDRRGCMQDIHWPGGSIGYFPTYTLGTLYAAQFWEAAGRAIPDLPAQIARGEFAALLGWLRRTIHAHGRRYTAEELCRRVCGGAPTHEPLLRHLRDKLLPIYGLAA